MPESRWRNYYGLPVTLAGEGPKAVDNMHRSGSLAEYEIGRFGLKVRVINSDPYYDAVIYQGDVAIAVVFCLPAKENMARALKEESPEKLSQIFGIRTTGAL